MQDKRKLQAKRKEVDLVEQSKAIDERPQQLVLWQQKFRWMIYHLMRKY